MPARRADADKVETARLDRAHRLDRRSAESLTKGHEKCVSLPATRFDVETIFINNELQDDAWLRAGSASQTAAVIMRRRFQSQPEGCVSFGCNRKIRHGCARLS